MTEQYPTQALILAGGVSSRMGQDKAALPDEHGRPLLARIATLASQISERVMVSVADDNFADELRRQWPLIADDPRGKGPLAGILAALRSAEDTQWLVLACDLPMLDIATLEQLLAIAAQHADAPAVAMRSEHDQLPEPMCAIWRPAMQPRILDAFAAQRYCARKCLIMANAILVDPVTPGALENMNTPQDRERLLGGAQPQRASL